MSNVNFRRVVAITIYLAICVGTYLATRNINSFCLVTGIMTILVGLLTWLFPGFLGSEKDRNSSIYVIICGVMILVPVVL